MKRLYNSIVEEHLKHEAQMIFLSGSRQVGKTTIAQNHASEDCYYNWDREKHRLLILNGVQTIAEESGLDQLTEEKRVIIFDEIHKYGSWKKYLKGFYDTYQDKCSLVVTGSSRLNTYKRGGDSLMGRYFLYRVHPLSIGELVSQELKEEEISNPKKIEDGINDLLEFGGFPEPFIKANKRFYNRWSKLRKDQLFREDLRDLTRIQELGQVEVLATLLSQFSGQLLNYSTLAKQIRTPVENVRRWIDTLESLHYCFQVKPWSRNITKSLRKQPKIYLSDWSSISDKGARHENFVACHLLKAVNWWTDIGLGEYELYFIRDTAKREVDFLVVKNAEPWFLVEVKSSSKSSINPALNRFQKDLGAKHAFQLCFDLEYIDRNCFDHTNPIKVPAETLLSQLV